ncbi:TonB-dependent siderophore receptor [Mucilaginibacter galii]|uniref:Ligand-gated channel n=1 Tax=Mucilaginibacter galii TaxID=2005073 RepID=A0A917N315_9SPHI|nr:TonB-dependent receptor [Mucilaginibacter galii]GGI50632.1 ligand-gated channel [Mucilaginibacter galii]
MKLTVLFTPLKRSGHGLPFQFAVALFAAALWCYAPALAQVKKPVNSQNSDTTRTLKEVQINAKRATVPNISPTSVQVLKGGELQRLNSLSVADALRYFAGVQLKDYGGIGGLKTVNVRSLGTNHTGVFYDGVAIGNAQNGQTDLGRFSLDNLEAVELYNGQKSSLLQPARAYASASTLYLQSKQPHFSNNERTHARVSLRSGSFGLINPALLLEQKLSNTVSGSFSTEWIKANGRYKFRETNGTYDTSATRTNADIDAYRLEAGLNGTRPDSSTWTVKAYLYHSNRGLPGAIVRGRFDYAERQWDNNFFIQTSYKTAGKYYNLLINGKYANDFTRYLNPQYSNINGYLDNRYRQQEAYLSAVNLFHVVPQLDVSLATDLQYNVLKKLDADQYRFVYPERYTMLNAFSAEYHIARFKLQGTILNTLVKEQVKLYSGAANRNIFSPSLSAIWQPFKSNDLHLRGFYKHIFRMPTFNDLYYTLIGNTSLNPEYTTQYDAGITYHKLFEHQHLQKLSVESDVYYNRVKDKIVAIPTTNLFRWTMLNIGLADIRGMDLSIKTTWYGNQKLSWHTGVNYTYQNARDVTRGADSSPLQGQIPYVPKHSGSAIVGLDVSRLQLNYSFIYTGERYNAKDNIAANYVQPWYTHDVSASWLQGYHSCQLKFSGEINNLINQNYDVVIGYPMPGRSYRFTLSISY